MHLLELSLYLKPTTTRTKKIPFWEYSCDDALLLIPTQRLTPAEVLATAHRKFFFFARRVADTHGDAVPTAPHLH